MPAVTGYRAVLSSRELPQPAAPRMMVTARAPCTPEGTRVRGVAARCHGALLPGLRSGTQRGSCCRCLPEVPTRGWWYRMVTAGSVASSYRPDRRTRRGAGPRAGPGPALRQHDAAGRPAAGHPVPRLCGAPQVCPPQHEQRAASSVLLQRPFPSKRSDTPSCGLRG